MEERLTLIERTVGKDGEDLLPRAAALAERLKSMESDRPWLSALANVEDALAQRSLLENTELLLANAGRIDDMKDIFEKINVEDDEAIDQKPLDLALVAHREARLSKTILERERIRTELVQLLNSYALWVDAMSECFAARMNEE